MMKKTLVLRASPNPIRYSYKATFRLAEQGHEVFSVGIKKRKIGKNEILNNIHTITPYVGLKNQPQYYSYYPRN